jgi:hypothetical protein
LRNDNLAQFVRDNFIPLALDLQMESERKDSVGQFFRQINKVPEGGIPNFTGASGRIHAMTADGTFFHCQGRSCRDCDPRAAWKSWNELPESKRKPGATQVGELDNEDSQVPVPPSGGLILQVFESRLTGDLKGELRRRDKAETFGWGVYEPGRDQIWICESDWKLLTATDRKLGDRFPLPAPIARPLIVRLTDWSEANGAHWQLPEHVRHQDLTLTVESTTADAVELRLEGSVRLAHDAPTKDVHYHADLGPLHHPDPQAFAYSDVRLLGYLHFDRERGRFTRFDVLALGEYVGPLLNPYRVDDGQNFYLIKPCPLGVVFELAPPGRTVPPAACFENH